MGLDSRKRHVAPPVVLAATALAARLLILVVALTACVSLQGAASPPTATTAIVTNATVVVNCSSIKPVAGSNRVTVVLQSSTTYVLNCTEAQPAFLNFTSNGDGGNGNLLDVVVHASGGNVLPRLSVVVANPSSGTQRSAVQNVSLWISDVHLSSELVLGTLPLFVVKHGISIAGVSVLLESASLLLSWAGSFESLFVFGPPSMAGSTSSSVVPWMGNVSFQVTNGCTIVLRSSDVGGAAGGPVLLLVHLGTYDAWSIHIAVHDSVLNHSGSSRGRLLDVASDLFTVATLDGLQLKMRNVTVLMVFSCPSGAMDVCRSNPPDRTGVISSLFSSEHFYRQQNVAVVVSNVVWTANSPEWDSQDRVSDQVFMIHVRSLSSRDVAINVTASNVTTRSGLTSAVLYVKVDECVRLHVNVSRVVANMSAWGTLNASSLARVATVVFLAQNAIPVDATISIQDTLAYLVAQGGESTPAAVALSSLIMSGANLLLLNEGSRNLSVVILGCTVHTAVRGGTAPLFAGLPVSSFVIAGSLMHMLQAGSHASLMVHVGSSAVFASLGCSANAGATYSMLSSISAALIASANCSDCRFDIVNTKVEIVAVSFDHLPPSASGSAVVGDVTLNNVATLCYCVDGSSIMPLVVPPVLLAFASEELRKQLLSAVWHQRTHTTLTNTSAALNVPSQTLRLVDTNRVVQHAVAVATFPKIMTDCTMQIINASSSSAEQLQAGSASAEDGVRVSTTLLLSFTATAAIRSTFVALNCSGISLLIAAMIGTLRIERSTFTFDRCVVAATRVGGALTIPPSLLPPPVAVTPCGSLRDGTVFIIDATNDVMWSIRNSQFSHLDALVNGSSTLLTSLVLGCNLWNSLALPPAVIGVPLEDVVYPRSAFEGVGGVVCKGLQTQTHSPSVSSSASEPPAPTPEPTAVSVLSVASTVASVATLVSSVGPVVPRAAVGAMQGVFGLLRLVAACRLDHGADANDALDGEEEGAAVMDNPLQLSLAIDSARPELRHVAGAVVGNTVFVFVVGVALHVCARGRKHMESLSAEPNVLQRLLLDLLPKTLWPGCLLVPLGILIEPVVKMTVLLMAFGGATGGALGGVMLAAWLAVVAFVAFRLLRVRPFPMRSFSTRTILKVCSPPVSASFSMRKNLLPDVLRAAVQWATEPTELLAPPKGRRQRESAALLEAHYACVYEPYKTPFVAFFVVEYGSAVLVGVLLGAAATVDPTSACSALQWCGWLVAVLFLGIAAAVVCLRPFVIRSDIIGVTAIQITCAASAIAAALTSADAAEGLALVASCVELSVVVVGIVGQVANTRLRRSVCWWSQSGLMLRSSTTTTTRPRHSRTPVRESRASPAPITYDTAAALDCLVKLICKERQQHGH